MGVILKNNVNSLPHKNFKAIKYVIYSVVPIMIKEHRVFKVFNIKSKVTNASEDIGYVTNDFNVGFVCGNLSTFLCGFKHGFIASSSFSMKPCLKPHKNVLKFPQTKSPRYQCFAEKFASLLYAKQLQYRKQYKNKTIQPEN